MNEIMTNKGLGIIPEDIANVGMLGSLKNPTTEFFCSINDDGTRASKVAIYNSINNDGEKLIDHCGETLEITDVAAHGVSLADEKTGEINEVLRVVLIATDGTTYSCVSSGVIESLKKIFAIVGVPSWKDEPVKIIPTEVRTKQGRRVLTLVLA